MWQLLTGVDGRIPARKLPAIVFDRQQKGQAKASQNQDAEGQKPKKAANNCTILASEPRRKA